MKRMDNDRIIQFIDNRNYRGESKFLWATYYGHYNNPISALISLVIKR